MMPKKIAGHFIFTFCKTLNPNYYTELADRELSNAVRYFLTTIFIAFLVMAALAIPKIMDIKSNLTKDMLDITELKLDTKLKTVKPVSLPRDSPLITLDTTNTKKIETELLLVTDNKIYFNLIGKKGEIKTGEYDLTGNRESSLGIVMQIMILFLPGIFCIYYLIYLMKYILIIGAAVVISFFGAKMMKNAVTLKQAIVLGLYTSTIMIILEILTIPFFIRKYLLTLSPFFGISFSVVAITAYLTLYITSIRITGNTSLKE